MIDKQIVVDILIDRYIDRWISRETDVHGYRKKNVDGLMIDREIQ